jgi:hypothetical protein
MRISAKSIRNIQFPLGCHFGILPRIMICDFENGSRMLPLLSKISDSQGGGSILLPFLDCIF